MNREVLPERDLDPPPAVRVLLRIVFVAYAAGLIGLAVVLPMVWAELPLSWKTFLPFFGFAVIWLVMFGVMCILSLLKMRQEESGWARRSSFSWAGLLLIVLILMLAFSSEILAPVTGIPLSDLHEAKREYSGVRVLLIGIAVFLIWKTHEIWADILYPLLAPILGGRPVREQMKKIEERISVLKRREDAAQRIGAQERQDALELLMMYPPARWARSKWASVLHETKLRGQWLLNGCDLSGVNLAATLKESLERDATKGGWKLAARDSDCEGIQAADADLAHADFSRANLKNANLEGVSLKNADLASADLTNADLTDAYLVGADLTDATLTNANLAYARLGRSAFYSAYSRSRSRYGARIDRASLWLTRSDRDDGAISLQDLRGCCWDQSDDANKPLLPEGIDPYDLDDIPRPDESAKN